MTILLLCSAAGAPGVTSTALGLALWWPREVVLVDADPHPGHAVEAGYLGGRGHTGAGLAELARCHRQGGELTSALWSELIDLPHLDGAEEPRVHFLAGFGHPAQPTLFHSVWPALATSLAELGQAGIDVIVDLGRVSSAGAGSAPGAGIPVELAARAAVLGVVSRTGLRPLAGLSLHREQLDTIAKVSTASVGLVLVGAGQPYSAGEIQAEFGLPVLAEVVADPRAAAVLSDGVGVVSGSIPRRWRRGRYVSSLRHAAGALHRQMAQHAGIARHDVIAPSVDDLDEQPGEEYLPPEISAPVGEGTRP